MLKGIIRISINGTSGEKNASTEDSLKALTILNNMLKNSNNLISI